MVPDRAYLRQKSKCIKVLFLKKAVCGGYPRSGSTGYKIWWRACRQHGGFLIEKKGFIDIVWRSEVGTEVQTDYSDGAGRQCMRGELIPHHGAGEIPYVLNPFRTRNSD